jgi:iron complex transport system substrate-binding protein
MNLRNTVIAVMILCVSVALVPANASDFTLEIFGNANMDDTIDALDIEYVKEIINGSFDETEFADANQDGKINENDISQIEMIMGGEQDVLNILDGNGKPLAVKTPVNRVIVEYRDTAELMEILDAEDKVIGVTSYINQWNSIEFPELSNLPTVGKFSSLDYEAVLSLNPDLLLTFGAG